MGSFTSEIASILVAAVVFGGVIGWLVRGVRCDRRIDELNDEWQSKADDIARQKDHLTAEITSMRATTTSLHQVIQNHESTDTEAGTAPTSEHEKDKIQSDE